jgi:hypothetical protein
MPAHVACVAAEMEIAVVELLASQRQLKTDKRFL